MLPLLPILVGLEVDADLLGRVLLPYTEVEPALLEVLSYGLRLCRVAGAGLSSSQGDMAERERRYARVGIWGIRDIAAAVRRR
jgi:hypothetical protein